MLSHWLKEKKPTFLFAYLWFQKSLTKSIGNEKDYPDFYILESKGISISNAFICLQMKFAQFQYKNFLKPHHAQKKNNNTNTWFSCDLLFYNH